jgi:hypothetical protein
MREACMRVAWSTPGYKIRVWCAHLKIANVLAALLRYIRRLGLQEWLFRCPALANSRVVPVTCGRRFIGHSQPRSLNGRIFQSWRKKDL